MGYRAQRKRVLTCFAQRRLGQSISIDQGRQEITLHATDARPSGTIFAAIVVMVVGVLGVSSLRSLPAGTASTTTTGSNFETPVEPSFFINGESATGGVLCFEIPSSQPADLNVTATYPWPTNASLPTNQRSVPIDFAFESFPLTGAVPKWLTLSMEPSHVVIPEGTPAVSVMVAKVDAQVSNGTQGSIALGAAYVDPASGLSATEVIVINLLVNSSSDSAFPC